MITDVKPLAEITTQAIRVLCNEIGLVNSVRFINQFSAGYGNYTEERKYLLGDITLDAVVGEIRRKRAQDR